MSTVETYRMDREGIALSVRYRLGWLNTAKSGLDVTHLEVMSEDHVALPMTETGHKSHFLSSADVEAHGGPLGYVRAWLEHEAKSVHWRKRQEAEQQLSLF